MNAEQQQQPKSITIKLPFNGPKPVANLTYVLALLLFFLPFMKLKCNDQTIFSVSGKDLITGFNVEESVKNSMLGSFFPKDKKDETSINANDNKSKTKSDSDLDKVSEIEKPNKLAIFAVITGLLACVFSFLKFRRAGVFASASGGVAGLLLLLVFFSYQSNIKDFQSSELGLSIGLSFTIWYFLCVLFFFVGSYFSHQVYLADEGERHHLEMEEYMKQHNYNSEENLSGDS